MPDTFFSPLSANECIKRFTANVAEDRDPLPDGEEPFLGSVEGPGFSLRARPARANSFAPVFYGTLRQLPNGTRIEGHFGLDPSVRPFMLIWFAFAAVAVFSLACSFASILNAALSGAGNGPLLAEGDAVRQLLSRTLWVLLVPLASASVWLYWRIQARAEKVRILAFLLDTLRARPDEAEGSD